MFMMCPLNFTASFDQIMDARADDVEVKDYISVIRKAQSKKGGKYRANFFTVEEIWTLLLYCRGVINLSSMYVL